MGMFTEEPLFDDPNLPTGWSRKVVQRQTGATAGQWDVYIYNPDGKKFRSRNELRSYFTQSGTQLNSEDFDFSVKGKGHHNKDGPAVEAGGGGEHQNNQIKTPKMMKMANKTTPTSAKKVIRKKKIDEDETSYTKLVIKLEKKSTVDIEESKTPKTPKNLNGDAKLSKYFASAIPKIEFDLPLDPRVLWDPPESPYKFIQELLYRDPWRLLISTIFLNKTSGKAACPLVWKFLERWPCPQSAAKADPKEIAQLMYPLGLQEIRAKRIIKMSGEYLSKKWENPTELYGVSKYGQDSYRLFCRGEWRDVRPTDIMLRLYQDWIWTNHKALKLE